MKNKEHLRVPVICLCWLAATALPAQQADTLAPATTDTTAKSQSLTAANIARRSAFLPGYGQYTNGDYWKIPLTTGSVAAGGWAIHYTTAEKKKYILATSQRLDDDPATLDPFEGTLSNSTLLLRTEQRNRWNAHAWMFTIYAYGMQVFDAYASARLQSHTSGHSPLKAAYYSALLPGLGQAYNRKWWKVPIVYAALGTSVGFVIFNQQRYRDTRIAYITRTDNAPTDSYETAFTAQFSDENLITLQQFYRRNRDLSYIITAGLYLLNVVDAIVDGHLYNFNVSDDLSQLPAVRPMWTPGTQLGHYGGLQLEWTF